jgi:hypothetical protein
LGLFTISKALLYRIVFDIILTFSSWAVVNLCFLEPQVFPGFCLFFGGTRVGLFVF